MNLKKIFCSIVFLFLIVGTAFAETIIAPENTKFSVKITDAFSTLSVGDYRKIPVNPRTLKNKKINWSPIGVTPDSKVFFTGVVTKVDSKKLDSGILSYYAQFDVSEFVANGKSYKTEGKLSTNLDACGENELTYNYEIVILQDLKDDDVQGDFTDKTEYYAKIKAEKEKAKLQAEKAAKAKAAKEAEIPYPTKITYPNWYYRAVKRCEATLNPGNYMTTPFSCLATVIQDPTIYYNPGYITAVLPYFYANYGQTVIETDKSFGTQFAVQTLLMTTTMMVSDMNNRGTGNRKITQEASNKFKTGK
jgi:hypothetical protein